MSAPLSWSGGRLDGTPWQGIRYLSVEFFRGATVPVVLTAHLNQPVGSLTAGDVVVRGGRSIPVPRHDVALAGRRITIRFYGLGDHSAYAVELRDGGGAPLHPFFSSAEFRFTVDCDAGDCRDESLQATSPPAPAPAVDLLTKDFAGFVQLLGDWVAVRNPRMGDLSEAAFERVMLELLAWEGDLDSYYQDRVAAEAFVETATQRYSLRQHAVLLGATLDDGTAPTTLLGVDVEASGFLPAGLQVRMRTAASEVPVTFVVAERTRVVAESSSDRLRVAAFPDAVDAAIPAGATTMLVWGDGIRLEAGDRLAFVQGSFTQVVTLAAPPVRLQEPGWVADPSQSFDPLVDPPAVVTGLTWKEPLARAILPWQSPPLSLYGNVVDLLYGAPRTAVVAPAGPTPRGVVPVPLTRRTSVVTRDSTRFGYLLRGLRVPEWPVVHDGDGAGGSVPAVELTVSGEQWTRVEHLHASTSYDLHYTAAADEDGAVWLEFGDGVHGHEIALASEDRPATAIELSYRVGDAVAGNVGLGTLVDVVRPPTGSVEEVALDDLGDLSVANVVPATGGTEPQTLAQVREWLPASLRHGPLQRAVSLADYATVAMDMPGVERATARAAGGLFNTVLVLVDPAGGEDLDDSLREAVHDRIDLLRMTGREHVVLPAEYVPLDVELVLCVEPGFEPSTVRDRVLAELRPGTNDRPGYFHPDRLSFGDSIRVGDLLAFVQAIPGVRSVDANVFRPLLDRSGADVRDVIVLTGAKVARLDADPDYPENGILRVDVVGLDIDRSLGRGGALRVTAVARHTVGGTEHVHALGGVRSDGTPWVMSTEQAIEAIRGGTGLYVVDTAGTPTSVVVVHRSGRAAYLRTSPDPSHENNLLSLPELPDA